MVRARDTNDSRQALVNYSKQCDVRGSAIDSFQFPHKIFKVHQMSQGRGARRNMLTATMRGSLSGTGCSISGPTAAQKQTNNCACCSRQHLRGG